MATVSIIIAGVVLAAGAGSRMGTPKAVLHRPDGTSWLGRACTLLRDAGCSPVFAMLGAGAAQARPSVPAGCVPLVVADWAQGMSASLRAALAAVLETDARAALVTLVDTPDTAPAALDRVLAAREEPVEDSLARAWYGDAPGHPVLIGRTHWRPLRETLSGDRGGAEYLRAHGAAAVQCGDLGGGADIDRPRT